MSEPRLVDAIDPSLTIDGWSAWALKLGQALDQQRFLRDHGALYAEVGEKQRTRMAWQRFDQLGRFARRVLDEGVPGDYAEFGTWRGGSLYLAAQVWAQRAPERHLLGFDSFEGLPAPDARDGHRISAGMFEDADYDETCAFFEQHGLARVRLIKGWFEDTIGALECRPLALCHIDADIYASVRFALEQTFELVSPGGYVVCDDYGHPDCSGATIAVEEFFARRPEIIHHTPGIDCSCWVRKEA